MWGCGIYYTQDIGGRILVTEGVGGSVTFLVIGSDMPPV